MSTIQERWMNLSVWSDSSSDHPSSGQKWTIMDCYHGNYAFYTSRGERSWCWHLFRWKLSYGCGQDNFPQHLWSSALVTLMLWVTGKINHDFLSCPRCYLGPSNGGLKEYEWTNRRKTSFINNCLNYCFRPHSETWKDGACKIEIQNCMQFVMLTWLCYKYPTVA